MTLVFQSDPAFDAGSVVVGDWPLCQVRLQDDARFPWLILIPRRPGLRELEDLTRDDRAALVEEIAAPDAAGLTLLRDASEKLGFSARAYHRVLKVSRTLADLDGADKVGRIHLAEAISYRIAGERLAQAA